MCCRFGFFLYDANFSVTLSDDGARFLFIPKALGTQVFVVFNFLEFLVEPSARIVAACRRKNAVDFPVIARAKCLDTLFALDHDRERRCLHATHGGKLKAA